MIVQMFSISYFAMIIIFLVFLMGSLIWLKTKSTRYKKIFIGSLLSFSLLLHFCKLFFPPYVNDDLAFRKITPENICAVSTLVFPFVFFSKSKTIKDYMFYLGVLSGSLAIFLPIEAFGKYIFTFDAIRFYVAHIIITVAPFLMVATGLHKLDYRRIYKVPLVFIGVLCIILINEIILQEIGLVPMRNGDLLNPNAYRNFSMVFGVSPEFIHLERYLTILTPKIFMKIPFGEFAGEPKYWPIVWLIIPAFVLIGSLSFLLSLYWEKDHIKDDFIKFKKTILKV